MTILLPRACNSLSRSISKRNYAIAAPGAPRLQVFNRKTKWLQRERAAQDVEASRRVDYLRDEVASRLCERLMVSSILAPLLHYAQERCIRCLSKPRAGLCKVSSESNISPRTSTDASTTSSTSAQTLATSLASSLSHRQTLHTTFPTHQTRLLCPREYPVSRPLIPHLHYSTAMPTSPSITTLTSNATSFPTRRLCRTNQTRSMRSSALCPYTGSTIYHQYSDRSTTFSSPMPHSLLPYSAETPSSSSARPCSSRTSTAEAASAPTSHPSPTCAMLAVCCSRQVSGC